MTRGRWVAGRGWKGSCRGFSPLWKLKARKNSPLEPQEDVLSWCPQLLSQTFISHSVVSGKSTMKTLADLSSAEVCLLVLEWCLSAMPSLGGHGRRSFEASLINAPRDEPSLGPDTSKGPHCPVPLSWGGGSAYASGQTHAVCLLALGFYSSVRPARHSSPQNRKRTNGYSVKPHSVRRK